ncbi:N-glycosylase/DNA lyase [Brucella sp. NBRC 14130]|uniref:8-oxoguanine DNA glycosylase n=1 Tax=Brucella sp. NBRC 14130 TaxID=3075483 RepID=UPI0030A60CBD
MRNDAAKLEHAVAAICPEIEERAKRSQGALDERSLWWELACCLLSSQVPYGLAVAIADALDKRQLLLNPSVPHAELFDEILGVLRQPVLVDGSLRHYRFPKSKSMQLASARTSVSQESENLCSLLHAFGNAGSARSWLVSNVAGIGPKQASMFLRNSGISYDLAVLDRHVLNYMTAIGLYTGAERTISKLSDYHTQEVKLISHANRLGFAVGLLDWAIWIVMRVAGPRDTERALA